MLSEKLDRIATFITNSTIADVGEFLEFHSHGTWMVDSHPLRAEDIEISPSASTLIICGTTLNLRAIKARRRGNQLTLRNVKGASVVIVSEASTPLDAIHEKPHGLEALRLFTCWYARWTRQYAADHHTGEASAAGLRLIAETTSHIEAILAFADAAEATGQISVNGRDPTSIDCIRFHVSFDVAGRPVDFGDAIVTWDASSATLAIDQFYGGLIKVAVAASPPIALAA